MSRPHIIVIEPDRNQGLLYEEELEGQGYRVQSCAHPAEASGLSRSAAPRVVVMDGGACSRLAARSVRRIREAFADAAIYPRISNRKYC